MDRFIRISSDGFAARSRIRDTFTHEEFYLEEKDLIRRLNAINEEREYWKREFGFQLDENKILWKEIISLDVGGVDFSDEFKSYIDTKQKISTSDVLNRLTKLLYKGGVK